MNEWIKFLMGVGDVLLVLDSLFLIFTGYASEEHYVYAVGGILIAIALFMDWYKKRY